MAFQYAGRYGPEAVTDRDGNAQLGTSIPVLDAAGAVLATLYINATRTTQAANPVLSDAATGNLTFYADPGDYQLSTPSGLIPITVPMDPRDLPAHVIAADPHGDRAHSDSADTAHTAATDPHGDRADTTSKIATHSAAADPHGDRGYADTRLAALVNAAPAALDTLNELATALGDDANFATTMTTALAGKLNVIVHGATAGTARPAAATQVLWIGTVAPTNAVTNDLWWDKTATLLKLWSGSAWQASASGAYAALAPTSTTTTGNTFTVPAYAADTTPFDLYTDSPSTNASIIQIEHSAVGPASSFQAYGINIHNSQGATSAFVVHQYSNAGDPAVWLDNTSHNALLRLKATENQTTNPNSTGTGAYVEYQGYAYAQFTAAQMVSGTPTLAHASAAFVSTDVGRSVICDQVAIGTYISSIASTTIAAGSNGATLPQGTINVASTAGFNAGGGALMVTSSGGTQLVIYTGTTGTSFTGCTQGTGTLSTGGAVSQTVLTNNASVTSGNITFLINRGAAQRNGALLPDMRFVAYNALLPYVFCNNPGVTVTPLKVIQYNNTAAAMLINNQGNGNILTCSSNSAGTTLTFSILSSGQIKTASTNEATGAGSAALGANSPAVTNTAPYTWLKFTSSDGSQVFVPAWK